MRMRRQDRRRGALTFPAEGLDWANPKGFGAGTVVVLGVVGDRL